MNAKTQTLFTLALIASSVAHAVELKIDVASIKSSEGKLLVAVYDQASFMKKPVATGWADAKQGNVLVSIANAPQGELAVAVVHDQNSNSKMDKNMLGMPTEPYGFSNDAMGSFGPPSFDQAKVAVGDGSKPIVVNLR